MGALQICAFSFVNKMFCVCCSLKTRGKHRSGLYSWEGPVTSRTVSSQQHPIPASKGCGEWPELLQAEGPREVPRGRWKFISNSYQPWDLSLITELSFRETLVILLETSGKSALLMYLPAGRCFKSEIISSLLILRQRWICEGNDRSFISRACIQTCFKSHRFKKTKAVLRIATCISFSTSHRAGRDLWSQFDLGS